MLATVAPYLVAIFAMTIAALSALTLFTAVRHLD